MHAGIVGYGQDHTAVHTSVAGGKKEIGADIEADVFLRAEGTRTSGASAKSSLGGNFFVGSPFAVDLVVLGDEFGDLSAGGSGIRADDADAAFVKTLGQGFIAKH